MNHEIKPQLSLFLCGSTNRAAAAEVIANLVATGDNAQNKAAVGKDRAIPDLISLIMHGLLPKAGKWLLKPWPTWTSVAGTKLKS
jgi:hypothetical protein